MSAEIRGKSLPFPDETLRLRISLCLCLSHSCEHPCACAYAACVVRVNQPLPSFYFHFKEVLLQLFGFCFAVPFISLWIQINQAHQPGGIILINVTSACHMLILTGPIKLHVAFWQSSARPVGFKIIDELTFATRVHDSTYNRRRIRKWRT